MFCHRNLCRYPPHSLPLLVLDQACPILSSFLHHGVPALAKSSHSKRKPMDASANDSSKSNKEKRWLHQNNGGGNGSSGRIKMDKPTAASIRERNITVSSYYNQTAIDVAAAKVTQLVCLTLNIKVSCFHFSSFPCSPQSG